MTEQYKLTKWNGSAWAEDTAANDVADLPSADIETAWNAWNTNRRTTGDLYQVIGTTDGHIYYSSVEDGVDPP